MLKMHGQPSVFVRCRGFAVRPIWKNSYYIMQAYIYLKRNLEIRFCSEASRCFKRFMSLIYKSKLEKKLEYNGAIESIEPTTEIELTNASR